MSLIGKQIGDLGQTHSHNGEITEVSKVHTGVVEPVLLLSS